MTPYICPKVAYNPPDPILILKFGPWRVFSAKNHIFSTIGAGARAPASSENPDFGRFLRVFDLLLEAQKTPKSGFFEHVGALASTPVVEKI